MSFERYVEETLLPTAAAHEKPSILLLTCMDYRYAHRIVDVMDRRGMRGRYDFFVLAGAAAGSNQNPAWRETFVSHIRTALSINHPIDRILVLEHRNCGAYLKFFQLDWKLVTPPVEAKRHQEEVAQFISDMKYEFRDDLPQLAVDAILLARDEDDELALDNRRDAPT